MATKKTLSINLEFNADIVKAKNAMKELQKTIDSALSASASSSLGFTPEIEKARTSALELKTALQQAVNVNTGKLNLNKFQT
jgi:hypothetical protein